MMGNATESAEHSANLSFFLASLQRETENSGVSVGECVLMSLEGVRARSGLLVR